MIRHAPRSVILPVNPFLRACSMIREHHGPGFTLPSSSLWWACTYSQLMDSLKFSFAFTLFFLRLGLLALANLFEVARSNYTNPARHVKANFKTQKKRA